MNIINGHNRPAPMTTKPTLVGPFTVISLPSESVTALARGPHGMEAVPTGQKTENHSHKFVSLYVAVGLVLLSGNLVYEIPEFSLVIVPEGVEHSWIPTEGNDGFVGSLNTRHERQILVPA